MEGSQLVASVDTVDEVSTNIRHSRWSLKRLLIAAAALVFLTMAAVDGDYWLTTSRFLVSTDDAYV